jgi:hypothetical protein
MLELTQLVVMLLQRGCRRRQADGPGLLRFVLPAHGSS